MASFNIFNKLIRSFSLIAWLYKIFFHPLFLKILVAHLKCLWYHIKPKYLGYFCCFYLILLWLWHRNLISVYLGRVSLIQRLKCSTLYIHFLEGTLTPNTFLYMILQDKYKFWMNKFVVKCNSFFNIYIFLFSILSFTYIFTLFSIKKNKIEFIAYFLILATSHYLHFSKTFYNKYLLMIYSYQGWQSAKKNRWIRILLRIVCIADSVDA